MMLIEETPVQDSALPMDAFKAHLRLGSGFDLEDVQDVVIVSFLRAALAAIEARTGKAVFRRSFAWTVTAWRDSCAQGMPLAPVATITRLISVARDGTETDIAPAAYWLERDAQRPVLRASGAALPRIPSQGTMRVHFEAGYAPDWEGLPSDLRQAVMMLAAHYYEYRHDTGLDGGCMPFGVSSLIERYRTMRMGLGQ